MVKAKFKFTECKHVHTGSPDAVMATLIFIPVYGTGAENADWSKYTPSGKLEMNVTNQKAIDYFELGQDYFLTFEHAKPAEKAV